MGLLRRIKEMARQYRLKINRDKTPPRYVIERPGDFLHVPPDKLHLCLSELEGCLNEAHGLRSKGMLGDESVFVVMDRFTWIDDGERHGVMTFGRR